MTVLLSALTGCDSSSESGGGRSMDEMAAQVEAQRQSQQEQEGAERGRAEGEKRSRRPRPSSSGPSPAGPRWSLAAVITGQLSARGGTC